MLARKEIIRRIDRLFQTCRRYSGAWKKRGKWFNRCVTSGRVLPIEKIQAGHFIPRGCLATRWLACNCNPQSAHDNLYKNGAYIEYSHWFLRTYGEEQYERLLSLYEKHKQGKMPAPKMNELRAIYNHWLQKGRELETEIGPVFPKSWEPEPTDDREYQYFKNETSFHLK